jgi:hypothetical protein
MTWRKWHSGEEKINSRLPLINKLKSQLFKGSFK